MALWCSCYWWNDFAIFNITGNYYLWVFHKIYLVIEKSNNRSNKKRKGSRLFNGPFLFIEKLIKPITYLSPSSHISYWFKLSLYLKNISLYFSKSLDFMILWPSILSQPIHSSKPCYILMSLLFFSFIIKIVRRGKSFSYHLQYLLVIRFIL